jgi:hypothetical protein
MTMKSTICKSADAVRLMNDAQINFRINYLQYNKTALLQSFFFELINK